MLSGANTDYNNQKHACMISQLHCTATKLIDYLNTEIQKTNPCYKPCHLHVDCGITVQLIL